MGVVIIDNIGFFVFSMIVMENLIFYFFFLVRGFYVDDIDEVCKEIIDLWIYLE